MEELYTHGLIQLGGDNPKTSGTIVSFKFKAKQVGKANFSVSGDFYSPDEKKINPSFSGTSITIQEKVVTPPPSSGENNGGSSGENTNQGGTTGGGNNQSTNKPSGGNNTTTVSKNANLKELHLDVEGLSPSFSKNITNYNIIIQDINNINVNAIPEDSKAKISIKGNTNLKIGLNKIAIKVTAEDGKTTKTYTINATKTNNPDLANATLENLAIENVTLDPEFNKDITEYTTELSSEISSLNILAVPQIEGASINIQGNENLNFGENIITITVTAKDGVTKKDYIIKAYKKTKEEEKNETEEINPIEEINNNETKKSINVNNIIFPTIIILSIFRSYSCTY